MKNILLNLLLFVLPIFTVMAGPGNPPAEPTVPIDQYDYTLIIAAVLILAVTALYMTMRKKLKKA